MDLECFELKKINLIEKNLKRKNFETKEDTKNGPKCVLLALLCKIIVITIFAMSLWYCFTLRFSSSQNKSNTRRKYIQK